MNVLLINDSTSNPNWGDRAAAVSLKKMITMAGGNIIDTFSEDELKSSSFFSYQSNFIEQKNSRFLVEKIKLFSPPIVSRVKEKISSKFSSRQKFHLIPEAWDDFGSSAKRLTENKHLYQRFLSAIEKMDVAVIHGDGCMVGNGVLPRTELFLTFLIKSFFKKPVIITNHTADFDHPNLLNIAQKIYPLFDDVVFRDPISKERCRAFCHGRFVPDSAFLFEPMSSEIWKTVACRSTYFDVWPDTAQFDPMTPYICLGGSSIFSYDRFPSEIIDDYSFLIKYIQSIYSGQLVLTVSDVVDQPIFRALAKDFKLPLVGLTTSVQQAVDIIGNAEAYIGGRWHPSIFALRGGTPIISLSSKTFKMQALVAMAGLPRMTFDSLNLKSEQKSIGDQLIAYIDQGVELRNKIQIWAQEAAKSSWDNVLFLKK